MKLSIAIITITLLLVTQVSYANGGSGWRTIKNVKVEGSIATFIHPDTPYLNPDNCGNTTMAMIKFTDPAKEDKMAIALAAFMGGKKISSWFTGCETAPWGYTVPVIYNITIGN